RERGLLSGILSAPEFRGVHGPTMIDYLRERVQRFLLDLLGRVERSSAIPTVSRLAVDLLIAAALLMLAYTVYRVVRRGAPAETPIPPVAGSATQDWTAWLAQARTAADAGSFREAIHFAYSCGIAYLEAQGVWRPDPARTPREYLRLLPTVGDRRDTLAALTRGFERVWYGTAAADAGAFAAALADLKRLGCPPS